MKLLRSLWAQKNYRLALIVTVFLIGWMASGLLRPADKQLQQTLEPEATKALATVRARIIHAQPYSRQLRLRARTEPNRQVDVRAETTGRVVALPVPEGASVKAGQLLCELAEEDRALKVAEAQANLRKAQLDYDGAQRLKTKGYQSQSAIVAAEVALNQAKSLLKRQKLELDYTRIRAPFDGIVQRRAVELGTFMQRGDVCASVIDLSPLVLAGEASEREVVHLHVGQPAVARVLGQQLEGKLRYVSRNAEAQTRAFLVELAIANEPLALSGGLTSEMQIALPAQPAHVISPALLSLDDNGRLGVKVVNAQNRVEFVLVELLGDSDQGVWVAGLADPATLITVGQEYVTVGQQVEVDMQSVSMEQ